MTPFIIISSRKGMQNFFDFPKKTKKGVPKHFLVTPEVDDGRDEQSELPVYYNCRKERSRFFANAQNDRGKRKSQRT